MLAIQLAYSFAKSDKEFFNKYYMYLSGEAPLKRPYLDNLFYI
jgi:hypothetical protein